jgi:hypothetical protein
VLLQDFRTHFNRSIPVCEGFFELMRKTFGFYTTLCNDFLSNLGAQIENKKLDEFLNEKIKPRLFNSEYCNDIEKIKRQFLAENIKLEQFIKENEFQTDYLNDLQALKKVSDAIYELLQKHWELYRYQNSVVNSQILVSFLMEIDRIGIGWDSYVEKYLAVSRILTANENAPIKKGFGSLEVNYHIPENAEFDLVISSDFIKFLQIAFEFILQIHDPEGKPEASLEIVTLETHRPVNCVLMVPNDLLDSYKRFLNYLSVDVLKRETLIKFVMEVLRLQQEVEVPKAKLTPFQKKISKHLSMLHPEGYFSVNMNKDEDSVSILSSLCGEMEQLEIKFGDMLTGSTNRLSRNKIPEKVVRKDIKPDKPSTVKLNVKQKEHINFLTS